MRSATSRPQSLRAQHTMFLGCSREEIYRVCFSWAAASVAHLLNEGNTNRDGMSKGKNRLNRMFEEGYDLPVRDFTIAQTSLN